MERSSMRISLTTLGCKVNQAETATLQGAIEEAGYEIVPFNEKADIYIINTCTVTSKSDYQSRQLIRRAIQRGGRVFVTGCYAELKLDEIMGIEGVERVFKNTEKMDILRAIPNTSIENIHTCYSSPRSRAFLKIQDGCDAFCAYCTVPFARGRSRSLPFNKAIEAIDSMVNKGYGEVVFSGVHIGRYGKDLPVETSLINLVEAAAIKYPMVRFRLSSIEADEFNRGFIRLIEDGKLCPHLHFPLQSGSDELLKAMNRRAKVSDFKEAVMEVYRAVHDVSIGTDVIVGLPGESDRDFRKTYELLSSLPISYIHVFPYSPRPLTEAAKMKNQVPNQIKKERAAALRRLSKEKERAFLNAFIGKIVDVIVENKYDDSGHYLKGTTENYLKVLVKNNLKRPMRRVRARVKGFIDNTAICELI
ncbi:MAG: tRNA (N(6)-L-threonylcarbamoyladenosine(37)-C(2))-methylthiotransferase MtaB [Nitrospirae bacterium]|nr:MAG: tRNA (N(6)-L-threonylcarbamoyladenosine(37)-C(2))-methylthiotransferase MtaB [Nitrospirota bacterium]